MCGITGIFDTRAARPIERAVLHRMNESQHHRGPDEGSLHLEPGLGFGHRRLSIIDLATGQQPLFNEDGSVIAFGLSWNLSAERERDDGLRREDLVLLLSAFREEVRPATESPPPPAEPEPEPTPQPMAAEEEAPEIVEPAPTPVEEPILPTVVANPPAEPAPAASVNASATHFGVGVASFLDADRARGEKDRLSRDTTLPGMVVPFRDAGTTMYRVVLGRWGTAADAEKAANALMERGLINEARVVTIPKQ